MLILGLVLALLGWLTGIAIVLYIGVILLVVGAVLLLAGGLGHSMGGRRFWW